MHERPTKTDFFHFIGCYAAAHNVLDSVFRPNEYVNSHLLIIAEGLRLANHYASHLFSQHQHRTVRQLHDAFGDRTDK